MTTMDADSDPAHGIGDQSAYSPSSKPVVLFYCDFDEDHPASALIAGTL
jgi:hypothetical protein